MAKLGRAESLGGESGNDTYYVDNVDNNVVEGPGNGDNDIVDSSVNYNLAGRYVETLALTGTADINATGNSLAQTIVGNDGKNILKGLKGLEGTDILNGLLGADQLHGGAGRRPICSSISQYRSLILSLLSES